MDTTNREKILQYLETRILTVMRKSNGFYYEFSRDQVERFSLYGPSSVDLPRVIITSGDEDIEIPPGPFVHCTLAVYLSVYIVHDEGDRISTDEHINRLIGDIKKAVLSDNTLGGLAIDCVPARISPFSITDGQRCAGVVAELKIDYRHLREDPTQTS